MAHLISLGLSLSSVKEEPINCRIDALSNKELEKHRLTADPQKQIHKNISRATDVAWSIRVFAQILKSWV